MVTVEQHQMVCLLDQMSVRTDLLLHLQLRWQQLPARLLWLQMEFLLALGCLPMGTVEQHQMEHLLDQVLVLMVLQHHHHLEWHQMEFHLDLASHQTATLEQHLMEHLLDQE